MKCSDLSMKMYKTKEGRCKVASKAIHMQNATRERSGSSSGQQLREMLVKHGGFKELELQLKKFHKNTEKDATSGKWVTRHYLMEEKKYTKSPCRISLNLHTPNPKP